MLPSTLDRALVEVELERARQDAKWGEQNHDDGTGKPGDREHADYMRRCTEAFFAIRAGTWRDILEEEVMEAFAEEDPKLLRAELVQVAAVAVSWIESIDRRLA